MKQDELITQAASAADFAGKTNAAGPELAESELGAVFGIELDPQTTPAAPTRAASTKAARQPRKPAPAPKPAKTQPAKVKPTKAKRKPVKQS